ncbi:MAG: hypothetical protein HY078_11700 [Elusimicrobia bacterium]|nr:hypothetical protein [Elusimicrobiota bacterium]
MRFISLCLLLSTASAWAAPRPFSPEEFPLAIHHYGWRSVTPVGGPTRRTELFMLTLGDTRREDAKMGARDPRMGPFVLDSAQYAWDGSGAWRLFQFRMMKATGGPDDNSQAFLDFLKRRDVQNALQNAYSWDNFGEPGDFMYKRMNLRQADLPAPFDKMPEDALVPIKSIFKYNEDGTMNILLHDPYLEDGHAQRVMERLKQEIERQQPVPPAPVN